MFKIKFKDGKVKEFESLIGRDLSGSDLSGSDLSGLDLSGSDLRRANLSCADLRFADLSDANLSGVDLSESDLRFADLSESDLRRADLRRADLRDVKSDYEVLKAISGLTWDIVLIGDLVRVGCQVHRYEDWLKFGKEDIEVMDRRALDFYPFLLLLLEREYKGTKFEIGGLE